MFGFRARRRRKILAQPFPATWQAILHRDVGLYTLLEPGERSAVRDAMRLFAAEKSWEGTRDFELREPMTVVVAANASILTLGMNGEPLRHLRTIIIQPQAYVPPQPMVFGGVAHEGVTASGTAYVNGTVVLSWRDIVHDSRNPHDGRNVVLHELAHQLDMADGIVDGTPRLAGRGRYAAWRRVMTAAYEQLVDAAEHGLPSVLRYYGATSPGEFFAVATEAFFESPLPLRERHPALYDLLRAYYRQDTAGRFERAAAARR